MCASLKQRCNKNPSPGLVPTALAPYWDKDMSFSLSVPELCLIRFCVRDQTGFLSSDFVGQYTLPFTSLQRGETQRGRGRGQGGSGGQGFSCILLTLTVAPLRPLPSAALLWLLSFCALLM